MPKQKIRDPRRVYEFWKEHPDRSFASIGRTFHVTRARIQQIVKRFRELEVATETPPNEL